MQHTILGIASEATCKPIGMRNNSIVCGPSQHVKDHMHGRMHDCILSGWYHPGQHTPLLGSHAASLGPSSMVPRATPCTS
jgi:hypothetical protein